MGYVDAGAAIDGTASARSHLFRPWTANRANFFMPPDLPLIGGRAIRFDMLERLEDELDKAAVAGQTPTALLPKLVSLLGAGNDEANASFGRDGLARGGCHRRAAGVAQDQSQTPAAAARRPNIALAGLGIVAK